MEEEEDDDIYAPAEAANVIDAEPVPMDVSAAPAKQGGDLEEGEEEGEEVEEEDSDSDIDIITERKDEPKPEPTQSQRTSVAKTPATKISGTEQAKTLQSPAIKVEAQSRPAATPPRPGSSYPAVKTSKIDVDAKPIYEPNGKLLTQIDMDADFPEDDKPWRRPGTDMTDFFNYGFDEFTWASYCFKQESIRKDAANEKKQLEEMQNFLGMPGMPASGGAMPGMGMPGDDMMAQMMQQMMASGMDPSTMTPEVMMQYMAQANQGTGGPGAMGGDQGYGQQPQGQQQGFGYGRGGAGGGGRGRGQGRRNW